jgi:predicted helicase
MKHTHNMTKIIKSKHIDGNNYEFNYRKQAPKKGLLFTFENSKNGDVINNAFEVVAVSKGNKTFIARKLTPAIYVWTTEAYQAMNIYKIGLVNWQSVEKRLKQTDTTGVLQPIQLIEKFELNTFNPKETELIEKTIHTRLELMRDPITGHSLRERKERESFRGDWQTVLRPVIWSIIHNEFNADRKTTKIEPLQRWYQYAAEQEAIKHYENNDRGWIHWTCGTGKSFGVFFLVKAMLNNISDSNNTVCLYVPSKHLILQTTDDFIKVAEAMGYKVSPHKVYSEKDRSDSVAIKTALNCANKDVITLIVSTYQSQRVVNNGLKMSNLSKFDVVVGDEIHKTSGHAGKAFQRAIVNTSCKKRLYMTASPVFYHENDHSFSGQENEALYGKCFHRYGFLEAQYDGYITPLEVHGLTCTPDQLDEVKKLLNFKKTVSVGIKGVSVAQSNFTYYAMLHITLTAIKRGLITHPLIYTNTIKRGEDFAIDLTSLAPHYDVALTANQVKVLTGGDPVEKRVQYLNEIFSKQDVSVAINSRCLQEGISASKADSVILIDPRYSAADLIQILGRPVRLDSSNPNKIAKIFLPVMVEYNEENKLVFDDTRFATSRDWFTALVSADSDFANYFASSTDAVKLDFNEETRMGISYKYAEVESLPEDRRNVERNHRDDSEPKAPKTIEASLIEGLSSIAYQHISAKKIRSTKTNKQIIEHDVMVVVNDTIQQKINKLRVAVDEDYMGAKQHHYNNMYLEDTDQLIQHIVSIIGVDQNIVEAYVKNIEEAFLVWEGLKVELKSKCIRASIESKLC